RVPDIGVSRDQLYRRLSRRSNPDGRMRLLDWFWVGDGVGHLVIAAVEIRPLLSPQRLDDSERFAQATDPMLQAFDSVHGMLDCSPRGADTELEAAVREVVDGDCKLGQQRRIP